MSIEIDEILNDYNNYLMANKKGVETQIKLQEFQTKKAINDYRKEREENITNTKTGTSLKSKILDEYASHLEEVLNTTNRSNKINNILKYRILKSKNPILNSAMISSVVIDEIFDGVTKKKKTSSVYSEITKKIMTILKDAVLKEEQPGWMYNLEKNNDTTNYYYKRRAIENSIDFFKNENYEFKNKLPILDKSDFVILGRFLVVEFIKSTSSVKIQFLKKGAILVWTEQMQEIINELDEIFETSKIDKLPMIIKPVPWTDIIGGGFLNNETIKDLDANEYIDFLNSKIIRTPHKNILMKHRNNKNMDKVYKSLNIIQSTPFKVNSYIVDVLEELQNIGNNLYNSDGSIIFYGQPKKLPKLSENPTPEELKQYKKEAFEIHRYNNKTLGERVVQSIKIDISKKFSKLDEIYFPHNLDYRSRIYPMTLLLNTQGDDFGKSLLQFSKSIEVGKRGVYWLKYHLSNLFGNDKLHPDDRVKWVDDNLQMINAIAENPIQNMRDWVNVDSPFQFLAVCKEVSDMMKLPNPSKFKSRTSVAKDATNSGLQHWSAILRDNIGGKSVNLDNDNRLANDVYKDVSEKLIENLKIIDNKLSNYWLSTGYIDRSFCKRPTMTKVYGVKSFGVMDQVIDYLKKKNVYSEVKEVKDAIKFIRYELQRAVDEVVIAASEGMDWIQEVTKILGTKGFYITYTTPMDFKMYNYNKKTTKKEVATIFNKTKYISVYYKNTEELNTNRMVNSISPNFIHSLDASHLMSTCLKMNEQGVEDFWFIHDSFGVHPSNVDKLYKTVRETFVDMYDNKDILQELINQIESDLLKLYNKETAVSIISSFPEKPKLGTLDIKKVLDSLYFFN